MQWFFLTLIRIFDRRVKRDRRGPTSLDAFRQRAMHHICLTGFFVALLNGILALHYRRYHEVLGLEMPIALVSIIGYFVVRRARHVEWIAAFYMTTLATCISFWALTAAKSPFATIMAWYPLISFGTILLCGRWTGMFSVAVIFVECLVVLLVNRQYGFVLASGMTFELTVGTTLATMVTAFAAAFATVASVEVSRQRADRANQKTNALNLRRASLSLLGDMARDISRNMQEPLGAMHKKLDEVMQWNPDDVLYNKGTLLLQHLDQPLRELERLTESLLLFSHTHGDQDKVALRAVDFLNHLNELTREKAIARGVSLDFSADQPQAWLHVPAAAALFALVSLVNKGVEAAAGQEPAWVRLQLRLYGRQMQVRVFDSGPSLSYQERRTIQEQTTQRSAWDVNLRLSLDFLDSIGGRMTLDPYSPDTCYVISIPLSQNPSQPRAAA
ncbi:HAMP domain-containing histidine kinase [Oligoflexus tunisiensis]|uniref:HAMP domain-containing histidine kinase n=1 Tax=Oligoflexus tunisiensis TaxID=708132 RepID=UPI00114C8EBB|nr:HAMP domain-containing histidine kinase [Oligoflexus tunisiensis]